jgi:hypothetical protein
LGLTRGRDLRQVLVVELQGYHCGGEGGIELDDNGRGEEEKSEEEKKEIYREME